MIESFWGLGVFVVFCSSLEFMVQGLRIHSSLSWIPSPSLSFSIGHKQLASGYVSCLGQTHCGPPFGVAPDIAMKPIKARG